MCTYVGVVVGEEASVYMWEWWWGRRLVCTYVGVVVGEEASVYICGSGGGGRG